jgi:quinol monooxygenase YgiN
MLSAVAALSLAAAVRPVAIRTASAPPQACSPRCSSTKAGAKYCLNVSLVVKPERRANILKCIAANQAGALSTEPLAIEYLWGEDVNTPNTFHFFEQYQSLAGFEAHTKSPHFADWLAFEGTDPFTEPPRVVFYEDSRRD